MISNYICTFGLTEGKKSESDVREITSQRECDTPGVYFGVCRKNYPNLGCSVKISISRSRMCHISPNSKLFNLTEGRIWSLLKLLILGTNADSKIILEL
jgi:hypothetical protein